MYEYSLIKMTHLTLFWLFKRSYVVIMTSLEKSPKIEMTNSFLTLNKMIPADDVNVHCWTLIKRWTADAYPRKRMKIEYFKRADLVNGIWGDKIHTQSTVWRVIAFEIWIWDSKPFIEEILYQNTNINERTGTIRLIGYWWTEAASCKDGMNVQNSM